MMFNKRNVLFSIAGAFIGTAIALLTERESTSSSFPDSDEDDLSSTPPTVVNRVEPPVTEQ